MDSRVSAGLELPDFGALQPAAQLWVDTVANVRVHGETRQRPIDRFEEERAKLRPLNPVGFDLGRVSTLRASSQFRVSCDANRYSVPVQYANERVTLKAYPDRICIRAASIATRTSRIPTTRGCCWCSAGAPASSSCWCGS